MITAGIVIAAVIVIAILLTMHGHTRQLHRIDLKLGKILEHTRDSGTHRSVSDPNQGNDGGTQR